MKSWESFFSSFVQLTKRQSFRSCFVSLSIDKPANVLRAFQKGRIILICDQAWQQQIAMCDTLMRWRARAAADKKPTLESVTDTRESSLLHKKRGDRCYCMGTRATIWILNDFVGFESVTVEYQMNLRFFWLSKSEVHWSIDSSTKDLNGWTPFMNTVYPF